VRGTRGFADKPVDIRHNLVHALHDGARSVGAAVAGKIEGQRRPAGPGEGSCHVVVAISMFPKAVHDDNRRLWRFGTAR
jgi:hypothetical protein